ncbi:MAG: integrase core domain-containing protein [Bryobacteraceae bacterium]
MSRLTATPEIDQVRVQAVMEAAFREYGVPRAIRSDNGSPFSTNAPGGLSMLSIWWLRLGIGVERIEPGEPQQNGRHERFHWSLVKECLDYHIAWDCRLQQREFLAYRKDFNHERPHEALQMRTPAQVYRPSSRAYPIHLPEMQYDSCFHVRRVDGHGRFLWNSRRVLLTPVLAGEQVGFRECEDRLFEVWFGPVFLGWMDSTEYQFVREELAHKWAKRTAHHRSPEQPCTPAGALPLRPQDLTL